MLSPSIKGYQFEETSKYVKNQYDDAKYLDSLTEKEIKLEIDRRWKDVLDLPVPSNISKHALARDLALAKGFDISKKPVSASKQTESQREF